MTIANQGLDGIEYVQPQPLGCRHILAGDVPDRLLEVL